VSEFVLPVGTYLGWRYVDRQRGVERTQLYHDDGRVELLEGETTTELCRFTEEHVAAAKHSVLDSGLPQASDAGAGRAADAASVVYSWRLDSEEGSVANGGYPAVKIDAVERLDAALADIERRAGCGPLMADDEAAAEYAAMDD
jgi:hypothetical protein